MTMRWQGSFMGRCGAAVLLVALGDWLFWQWGGLGSNIGWFAGAVALAALSFRPGIARSAAAIIPALAALILAAILADQPSLLGLVLFIAALGIAVLIGRHRGFDSASRWIVRIAVHCILAIAGPWRDLIRLRRRTWPLTGAAFWRLVPLPLIGGAVFLALFAMANPVIEVWLGRLTPPDLDVELIARSILWLMLATFVWGYLRPRKWTLPAARQGMPGTAEMPGFTTGSVTTALVTFNLLFALQNGLDIAFLWSGAPLPDGMTLAEYAHRGAYPLIATALLAGLFVLVALRPGTATASNPLVRWLVILWTGQNLFLVASTIERTMDYVEAYSLTRLRIAALIWMALVAVGLVLILWRVLRGHDARWLVNANAAVATAVLMTCSLVDLGAMAATWNVRHAAESGGRGAELDLCYLDELGSASLIPLVELELARTHDPVFLDRIAWVRSTLLRHTLRRQTTGNWTWRDHRRIETVKAMTIGRGLRLHASPDEGPNGRGCDGTPNPPPVMVEPADTHAAAPSAPAPDNRTGTMPANPSLTSEAVQ